VPLHQWFLSLGLPLDKFESIRIPLKKEWLEFAQKMKEVNIEPPFVVIRVEDGEVEAFIYRYENFIKEIERSEAVNITREQQDEIARSILVKQDKETETVQLTKKVNKKQSIVKKEKTKTTEFK
jgi:hypothetical protein